MGCLMAKECPYRTAVCYISPPDEGCYVYRYFKEIFDSPTGEWIWEEEWSPSIPMSPRECQYAGWVCSRCHEFPTDDEWDDEKPTFNYCPNCGAKMKNWGC